MYGGDCIGWKRQELHLWSIASIASGSAYIYSVLLMLKRSSIGNPGGLCATTIDSAVAHSL